MNVRFLPEREQELNVLGAHVASQLLPIDISGGTIIDIAVKLKLACRLTVIVTPVSSTVVELLETEFEVRDRVLAVSVKLLVITEQLAESLTAKLYTEGWVVGGLVKKGMMSTTVPLKLEENILLNIIWLSDTVQVTPVLIVPLREHLVTVEEATMPADIEIG